MERKEQSEKVKLLSEERTDFRYSEKTINELREDIKTWSEKNDINVHPEIVNQISVKEIGDRFIISGLEKVTLEYESSRYIVDET